MSKPSRENYEKKRREAFENLARFKEFITQNPEYYAEGKREVRALDATIADDLPVAETALADETSLQPYPHEQEERPLEKFGKWLMDLRLLARFPSLDAVVSTVKRAAVEEKKQFGEFLSKSMLSLYERGEVKNIKPQTLWLLSQLYKVPYEEMLRRWAEERYHARFRLARGFVEDVNQETCTLAGTHGAHDVIQIMSIGQLQEKQGNLPTGSEVVVAALNFLDDGPYYPMVTKNLGRGIRYTYMMPAREKDRYESSFLGKINRDDSDLFRRIRESEGTAKPLTRFFPRPDKDDPVNFTLHLRSDDRPHEGFVGILSGDQARYFYAADPHLTGMWYASFVRIVELLKQPDADAIRAKEEQISKGLDECVKLGRVKSLDEGMQAVEHLRLPVEQVSKRSRN